jgi:signal transduction histidine kinase/CheY-like chemotaxis protein
MNVAATISLVAASVNLVTTALLVAISRAPRWRIARVFAFIALTAGLYNVCGLTFCLEGLDHTAYLVAGRVAYLVATLHCVGWVVFAHTGRDGAFQPVSAPVRGLILLVLAVGAVFAATGLHLQSLVSVVEIPWAGVRYHYPLTTPLGDLLGFLVLVPLGVAFARLLKRVQDGESALRWQLAAFGAFLLCVVDEILVANRVIEFLSLADLGFLLVVLPISGHLVVRLVADARRLERLSGQLKGEVRERTEERDRAELALVEAERLAALGRLAAGVGHEINNPLTYMQLALSEAEAHLGADGASVRVREALSHVRDGAHRIQRVVEGLRSYSRRQDRLEPMDPRDAVRAALRIAGPPLRHVARVETDLAPIPQVLGDEPRLVQALVNLLVNAGQALSEKGAGDAILVSTATGSRGEAVVTVKDDGPGIAPELLSRLTEPYFTTRSDKGGLGLGLFVTRGIIDGHKGRLEIESVGGKGTQAKIVLPPLDGDSPAPVIPSTVAAQDSSADPVPAAAQGSGGVAEDSPRARLLLIDDEPVVLEFLELALQESWDVTTATSGLEALRALEGAGFDLVVCDLMMPGMSGMDFAEQLSRRNPALRSRTVFLTGGAVTPQAEQFLGQPSVRYLTKPVPIATLDQLLRDLSSVAS